MLVNSASPMKPYLGRSRISVLASHKMVLEHIKWGDAGCGVQRGSVSGSSLIIFLIVCLEPGRRFVQVWGEALPELRGFRCGTKLQLKL